MITDDKGWNGIMLRGVVVHRTGINYFPRQGVWVHEAVQEEVHVLPIMFMQLERLVVDGEVEAEQC